MSALDVRWSGGTARLVTLGVGAVVLRSSVPSPPGSRIEGVVEGERGFTLRVKVHACRRDGGGDAFVLEGRPLDLAREHRERLEALVREAAAGS